MVHHPYHNPHGADKRVSESPDSEFLYSFEEFCVLCMHRLVRGRVAKSEVWVPTRERVWCLTYSPT